ncbi:MAG TPA: HAD-IIIC family phosphatase [Bryobacteraceae bacterium]|jgi:FkbH-like protein
MSKMDTSALRAEIDQALAQEDWQAARRGLERLGNVERSSAAASFAMSRYERLRPYLSLTPGRLAILRSFTVEPLVPLLRARAFAGGLDLEVHVGGFDNYAQQMLDSRSELYAFRPDVVVLAIETRAVLPGIWEDFTALGGGAARTAAKEFLDSLSDWVRVFRSQSEARLLLHTFEVPTFASAGILDAQTDDGQTHAIEELNHGLRKLAAESTGVYAVDYDALVARHGRERWHDERKWLTMRMPIAADCLPALAEEWLRFLHPLMGRIAKVLVTDLDNTLWGGVLGEDGIAGLQLGREYPGAAYLALQRALVDFYRRGIVLAIASKNNEAEALAAIETHPAMLVTKRHFAAWQIHWDSKVESLRRIAAELNVGLDSLVFLDDNPAEREAVRLALPEITVLDLPADPMHYANVVRACPLFERLAQSAEDRARGEYYQQQKERRAAQNGHASLEDFYYSLAQKVEIRRVSTPAELARVAQLIGKTNQFNLTTRRHTAVEIAGYADADDWDVYTTEVSDRFGDNGIVGVAMVRRGERAGKHVAEIDTFLLSCRVIGRTVEDAMLHFLVEDCRRQRVERMLGWFVPTAKNKPAETFYARHGFHALEQTGAGTFWALDLDGRMIGCPPWIELRAPVGAVVEEVAHA